MNTDFNLRKHARMLLEARALIILSGRAQRHGRMGRALPYSAVCNAILAVALVLDAHLASLLSSARRSYGPS